MAVRPPTEPAALVTREAAERRGLRVAMNVGVRIVLGLAGVFFFILGIQLMRIVAGDLRPTIETVVGPLTREPWHALAFGWLAAYAVLSGSPIAALTLGLFHVGALTEETAYFMIMGSRLGAAFVVLLIGVVAVARGQPREKSLAMGVLSFLVTYSIYLPAILLGWVLLRAGVLGWFEVRTPQAVLDYLDRIFGRIVVRIQEWLGSPAAFLLALVAIYVGLALFDRAFGRREERELKSPRMHRYIQHPVASFVVGALVTLASTSVSLSLGLLVPLYLHGYIDRRTIIPYIMGANITTFVDTLIAAIVLGGGVAANIVLLEMFSVTLFSILALLAYRRYSRGIEAAYTFIFHSNWALGAFILLLFAVPLTLLFVF